MSKEIEGYYRKGREPTKTDIPGLNTLFEAICSHDGWLCPHCGEKSDVWEEEMGNDTYFKLLHEYEPIKMFCQHCDKEYYLKCRQTLKYSTCADESFGEKESPHSGEEI